MVGVAESARRWLIDVVVFARGKGDGVGKAVQRCAALWHKAAGFIRVECCLGMGAELHRLFGQRGFADVCAAHVQQVCSARSYVNLRHRGKTFTVDPAPPVGIMLCSSCRQRDMQSCCSPSYIVHLGGQDGDVLRRKGVMAGAFTTACCLD
jgi:hypothetical protein